MVKCYRNMTEMVWSIKGHLIVVEDIQEFVNLIEWVSKSKQITPT